jgi:hypothetical protein
VRPEGERFQLAALVESGTSDDPQQVGKDISTLLAEDKRLKKDVAATLQNMKSLLKGVRVSITVGES